MLSGYQILIFRTKIYSLLPYQWVFFLESWAWLGDITATLFEVEAVVIPMLQARKRRLSQRSAAYLHDAQEEAESGFEPRSSASGGSSWSPPVLLGAAVPGPENPQRLLALHGWVLIGFTDTESSTVGSFLSWDCIMKIFKHTGKLK